MPNFSATADIHRLEMRSTRHGEKNSPGPRYLRTGTLVQWVNTVMAKREPDRAIYSITVPLEADFGKTELHHRDIEAIWERPDFPQAQDAS